jgi:hypothetical protein
VFKRDDNPSFKEVNLTEYLNFAPDNELSLKGCLRGALAPLFNYLPPLLSKERGSKGVRLPLTARRL